MLVVECVVMGLGSVGRFRQVRLEAEVASGDGRVHDGSSLLL